MPHNVLQQLSRSGFQIQENDDHTVTVGKDGWSARYYRCDMTFEDVCADWMAFAIVQYEKLHP